MTTRIHRYYTLARATSVPMVCGLIEYTVVCFSLRTDIACLWAADLAEHPEADQAGHDQVDGNEVIEKARKNQDENPRDNRYEG